MAVWTFFGIALLWDWNEEWSFPVLWPLPSFPSLWHIEHSTLTASSFRIWNSPVEIPSLPLSLFMLILPKTHLTSHSKISGCRGVITPSWLSGSLRPFLYSSVCIWLWGWAIHSCCSSHLWHFWKGVPVIHQCRELEAPCCNDLNSMTGPVFSLDSLSCIIPAFSAVNAGALPGVLLLKPEHPAPTRNSGHECKPLLSWEVLFGNELCGEFSRFAFWAPLPLFPSEVPKLPLVLTCEEISECPGTFPPSQFPPQSAGPHPKIFFFFFF